MLILVVYSFTPIIPVQMDTRVEAGELRGSVRGFNPKFDSPLLFLDVTSRHYVVMRMMYFGGATTGTLLMKSASRIVDSDLKDYSSSTWTAPARTGKPCAKLIS